ncbi:hypothetical protein D3C81_1946820 [compost metagenome]
MDFRQLCSQPANQGISVCDRRYHGGCAVGLYGLSDVRAVGVLWYRCVCRRVGFHPLWPIPRHHCHSNRVGDHRPYGGRRAGRVAVLLQGGVTLLRHGYLVSVAHRNDPTVTFRW